MREILSIIRDYIKDRPVMEENNQDPIQMLALLEAEIFEYEDEQDPEKKKRELADITWFVLSMAILTGVDIEKEIREKAARNHLKRPAYLWKSGSYKEVDKKAREEWKQNGGDDHFYSIDE